MQVVLDEGISSFTAEEPDLNRENPWIWFIKKFPRPQTVRMHHHSSLEINLCFDIRGMVSALGKHFRIENQDPVILVLPPHEPHSYHIEPSEGKMDVFHFSLPYFSEYLRGEVLQQRLLGFPPLFPARRVVFDRLRPLLRRVSTDTRPSNLYTASVLLQILDVLFDCGDTGIIDRGASRLRKIIDYAEHHCSEYISLKKIASVANMSPSAFCRYFKANAGTGFRQFLTDLRLEKALRLLQTAELPPSITTLALETGFYDASHFIGHFKKKYGVTPYQYYKKIMN